MAIRERQTNAGLFNQRITVQINAATDADRDDTGAVEDDWQDSFTCWAAYEPIASRPGGAEYADSDKRLVESKALFRVAYHSATAAIAPESHQIVWRSATWNIQRAFDPDGLKNEIYIETNSIV